MVAEWRHSGRHRHGSMHATGDTEVAQRRHKGGRSDAQIEGLRIAAHRIHCVATVGRPLCIHSTNTAMPLRPVCLIWATNLLGDPSATVLKTFKIWRWPWRPWPLLNVLCTPFERPWQPCCLLWTSNADLASFRVARGRHKGHGLCVNGLLPTHICVT